MLNHKISLLLEENLNYKFKILILTWGEKIKKLFIVIRNIFHWKMIIYNFKNFK